ncbi:MAG: preprotein translocase subunit SecA, partial [Bacteroidetes bacterium]|nr:preprotein translocase subunit SecA [Bacteroidota bacterium]
QKNNKIAEQAIPVIKQVHEERGATVKNIVVPFTDGKRQIAVESNLEKNLETGCKEIILSMEKSITLSIIDMLWKDHLRDMDDLKQSVQNAVYEQKDPLLIYKFEAFELFKRFIGRVNEETISFLIKANLPVRDPGMVQEAQMQRMRQQQKLQEQKEESAALVSGGQGMPQRHAEAAQKVAPVKSAKMAGRNDRVSVQYSDGTIKKNVKYKLVEEDVKASRCVLIDTED